MPESDELHKKHSRRFMIAATGYWDQAGVWLALI